MLPSPGAAPDARSSPPELLIAVAAPAEARAVRFGLKILTDIEQSRIFILPVGVGKSPAAARTAFALARHRSAYVLNVGIAGLLPSAREITTESGPRLGEVLLASASIFADEGVRTADAFIGCDEMGFPPVPGDEPGLGEANEPSRGLAVLPDPEMADLLGPLADHTVPIATVSSCSGTDAAARELAERTGAIAEAMEGAAVGLAARLSGEPHADAPEAETRRPAFAELRVLSNTTGERTRQLWDLEGALERLGAVAAQAARRVLGSATDDRGR